MAWPGLYRYHLPLGFFIPIIKYIMLYSPFLVSLLVLTAALLCCNTHGAETNMIGNGYRLISIQDSPDGGLVGHLQVKKKNNAYGPDISLLQLYVK